MSKNSRLYYSMSTLARLIHVFSGFLKYGKYLLHALIYQAGSNISTKGLGDDNNIMKNTEPVM